METIEQIKAVNLDLIRELEAEKDKVKTGTAALDEAIRRVKEFLPTVSEEPVRNLILEIIEDTRKEYITD